MAVNDYDPIIQAASQEWNVDPTLVKAVMQQETGGNTTDAQGRPITSPTGVRGLMQITGATARHLGVTDVTDPVQAIYGGTKYLSELLDQHKDPAKAVYHYNGGSDPDYTSKVAEHYQRFAAATPPAPTTAATSPDIADFLKRTGAAVPDAPAATATPAQPAGEDVAAFLKRTGATEPAPMPPNIAAIPMQAPVGGEFGDLAAQPWAQGAPADPTARAPIAKAADAAIQGFTDAPRVLTPYAQGLVNKLGPIGQQIINPALQLPFSAGNALMQGVAETANQLTGNPRAGRDAMMLMQTAPMAHIGFDTRIPPVDTSIPATPPGRPQFVSERFAPQDTIGLTPLHRINQLIAHDNAEISGNGPQMQTPPDVAQNLLAPSDGGTRSVGAAASRDMTAPGDLVISPRDTQAYRSVAETQKLLEPQPIGRDPTLYVNGVNPTQAHIEQSANVSRDAKMLESAIPEEAKTVAKEHNEARQQHFAQLAGSDVDINNAITARSQQAQTDLAATWQNKTAANPQPVFDTIQQILASPDGRRGIVRKSLGSVEDAMNGPGDKPFTDPEQLYGVRKHIDDLLSKEAAADNPASIRAKASLLAVKAALDNTIEAAAPGFRQYLDNFSRASKPIDEMQVLQKYEPKLIDTQGRMQLSRVQGMMKDIVTSRKSGDINPFNSISDDTMAGLWALRDDLRRVASSEGLASAKGSDTLQNAMDVAKQIGSGGAKLVIGAAAHAVSPIVGPLVVAPLVNRLTSALSNARTVKRAHNMLHPDPSQYRPLNPQD